MRNNPQFLIRVGQSLVRPDIVQSLAFRKAAMGVHCYDDISERVLTLKRAVEKRAWAEMIPLYCVELLSDAVCYAVYPDNEMWPTQWAFIGSMGEAVASSLQIRVDIENAGVFQC